jgi:dipeptidyl aminopeptidase/acylaminoacyl peptidase
LFGGSYFDSEEIYQVYRHHSPLTHVQNITAPLLLLHAEDDYRCPIDQSEQMLVALRMRKQTVELIRSPGATHTGVAQPHQRLMQWRLSKDWFDQFLRHEAPEMAAAEIGAEPVTVA